MNFDGYQYLWPPRPEVAIPANLLQYYEDKKWIAQYKKNGTCTLIYVRPDKTIITKTRHRTDHKQWTPKKEFAAQFSDLPGSGWYVFAGELLHSRTKHIKDTVYLFDLLVDDGEYLVGATLRARLDQLRALFPVQARAITKGHYVVTPTLWIARTIKANFTRIYKELTAKEDEGLVLKDPNAKLKLCVNPKSNSASQVKCRRPTKNYNF